MAGDWLPCPFRGRDGCNSGGGKGLSKKYFIDHLGSRHFSSVESRSLLKEKIASDPCLFSSLEASLKKAGIRLCGECLRTHSFSTNCKHTFGLVVVAPTSGDSAILGIPRPLTLACDSGVSDVAPLSGSTSGLISSDFDVDLLGRGFLKPFRTVKSIPPKLHFGFARVFLYALGTVIACPSDVSAWVQLLILPCCVLGTFVPKSRLERRSGFRERCQFDSISSAISRWWDPNDRRKLGDGHFFAAIKVVSSSGVAPFSEDNLQALVVMNPSAPPPTFTSTPRDRVALSVTKNEVLSRIHSFPKGT